MCPSKPDIAMSVPAPESLLPVLADHLATATSELELELYQHAMHDTYLMQFKDQTAYFKLYRYGLATREKLAAEVEYLTHLAKKKLAIAEPLATGSQSPIIEVTCPEGPRLGMVFAAVPGKFHPEPSEDQCRQYGRYLAKLHELGVSYLESTPKTTPPPYDFAAIGHHLEQLVAARSWIPSKHRTTFQCAIESLLELVPQIDQLPQSIVHGDAHLGNVRFVRNTPAMFDFDLMGVGPAAYDLAIYRWSRLLNATSPADSRKQWGALLVGYRSVRELESAERELLTTLTTARHLWFISYMIESAATHGRVWFENSQPRILRHLEMCGTKDAAA